MRNTWKKMAVSVGIAALAVVGLAAPASAAEDCKVGYWCGWVDINYSGQVRGSSYNKYAAEGAWINNKMSSASANGKSCWYTYFYDAGDWTGAHYTLYSKTGMGYNFKDPDLRNGAGFDGSNTNWNDRVSSVQFGYCQ